MKGNWIQVPFEDLDLEIEHHEFVFINLDQVCDIIVFKNTIVLELNNGVEYKYTTKRDEVLRILNSKLY